MHLIEKYEALGTAIWIEVFQDLDQINHQNFKNKIINIINEFEANYSRFHNNSLITKLNISRTLGNPSEEMIDILKLSQEFEAKTSGMFDIKIGHLLAELGYGPKFDFSKTNEPQQIIISPQKIQLKGNFALDLGGIGKAYLIRKISRYLENDLNLKYYLINFGGDINATSENENQIEISLEIQKIHKIILQK